LPFTTVIVGMVLVQIWFLEGRTPREFVYLPAGLVVALTAWHDWKWREWGFAPDATRRSLQASLIATLPVGLLFLAIGAVIGTIHDRRDFLGSLAALFVWGGAQQWVLQTVVLREGQRATSPTAGVYIAALLFAIVHLPNPFLAAVTGVAAIVWCHIYNRYPTILPLALSHALGTLAILYAFDETITGRLRIGMSYLRLGQ
jgi:membrane protease YdiL (CAAX protease family)